MSETTMQAALLMGHGGPDRLVVRDNYPIHTPLAGEVRIRVGAAGMNNTDIWTREGAYGSENDPGSVSGWRREGSLRFPRIQGGDIVGTIDAVGPDITETRIGERVLVDCTLYSTHDEGLVDADLIGSERDGGFAEYAVVPAENAHKVDTGMSDAELATFPIAYVTAERMLNRVRLTGGERLLVTGASGGVGSALIQLAKLRNAEVCAVTSRKKSGDLQALGVNEIFVRDDGALSEQILERLGPDALDVVADVVGGANFGDLIQSLRPEGRYVTAGAIANPLVELDLRTLYLKHLELIGSTMGTRKEFADLVSYIEAGKLTPLLAKTFPLSKIHEAQEYFRTKDFIGKLVLVPDALMEN